MQRVERHMILKSSLDWSRIDNLSFACKNLYNRANYVIRQTFIKTSKEVEEGKREHAIYLNYYEIDKLARQEQWEEYKALPTQTAQQTLRLLDLAWKSFFKAIKEWKKNPSKFNSRPKLPKYKHKTKGRSPVIFTNQQVKLKDGYVYFPKKAGLKPLKTRVINIKQVRIVPQSTCYVIEVVYEKEVKDYELDDRLYLGIDLGVNNLATLTSNKKGLRPIFVNGRPVKSINQYYNKKKAKLMSFIGNKGTSKRIEKLTHKRNQKIQDYLHKSSRLIIDYCLIHRIGTIVIGQNKEWKRNINIGKQNNQNFVSIPFSTLIQQIQYKAEEVGITVITDNEAYTSKCSFLDLEPIEKRETYLGKRVKRGLFRSAKGKLMNADINAAFNIIRKAVPNAFADGIEGVGLHPVKVSF